jgi:hypothetical protein
VRHNHRTPAPSPQPDDTPVVCFALDTIEERPACAPEEGIMMVCFYNDNFLSSVDFVG